MKKITYALTGAVLIVVATLTNRIDGGGPDIAGMFALGLALLLASIDFPQPRRSTS
jgi:hypothetical protein